MACADVFRKKEEEKNTKRMMNEESKSKRREDLFKIILHYNFWIIFGIFLKSLMQFPGKLSIAFEPEKTSAETFSNTFQPLYILTTF